jgi:hypothetical protein
MADTVIEPDIAYLSVYNNWSIVFVVSSLLALGLKFAVGITKSRGKVGKGLAVLFGIMLLIMFISLIGIIASNADLVRADILPTTDIDILWSAGMTSLLAVAYFILMAPNLFINPKEILKHRSGGGVWVKDW